MWYRAAFDHAPPPTRVTIEWITAERVDLYRHVPPLGENISVSVDPFQVEYLVRTEDEIEWLVRRLRNNHSGGPSGMRANHIKGWMEEARKAESVADTEAEEEEEATR